MNHLLITAFFCLLHAGTMAQQPDSTHRPDMVRRGGPRTENDNRRGERRAMLSSFKAETTAQESDFAA